MSDNKTPYNAEAYEVEVARTIPYHAEIIVHAVMTALAVRPCPERWLDTGCGPGRLVALARSKAPKTEFVLADPSEGMLAVARRNNADLDPERFLMAPSEELPSLRPFDVITAIQCHHYLSPDERERAVRRCFSLLSPDGVMIVFENVRSETERGQVVQRQRWAQWLREQGRAEDAVVAHARREGTQYFPLRPSEHVALLERVGFGSVETIWRAYGQAGFMAIADGGSGSRRGESIAGWIDR